MVDSDTPRTQAAIGGWHISKEVLIALIGLFGTIVVALLTLTANSFIALSQTRLAASIEEKKERASFAEKRFDADNAQKMMGLSNILTASNDTGRLTALVALTQTGALNDPNGAMANSVKVMLAHIASHPGEQGAAKPASVPSTSSTGSTGTPARVVHPNRGASVSTKPSKTYVFAAAGAPAVTKDISFVWPAKGRVISGFGDTSNGETNDGINIATPTGAPIYAAASGTVTYAGDELKNYGNLVLMKHPGGYTTAYAHAERLVVARGDFVARGQVIGYSGQTGDVTSPQLHFEIRNGTTPVDPNAFLSANSDVE